MRKMLTSAGLVSSALTVGMMLASPAAAATGSSQFDVVFPGQKPQTTYQVENVGAFNITKGTMTGKSVVYWRILDAQVVDGSKRFTSFKITTRIEERLTQTSEDHVVTSRTCDLTAIVNDYYSWSADGPANTCIAPSTLYDGELWWSSDSTIVYDIEGDANGPITQQLNGSPLIHG
ncbi:hypothetical protein ACIQ6Y_31965 [Streptomyces sp. NPDC096205]|uniref:hypothetical protein n=1 Tax=Streptomyces sp. NPDC096205 TaxID=3366081 RepID=UPI00380809EB